MKMARTALFIMLYFPFLAACSEYRLNILNQQISLDPSEFHVWYYNVNSIPRIVFYNIDFTRHTEVSVITYPFWLSREQVDSVTKNLIIGGNLGDYMNNDLSKGIVFDDIEMSEKISNGSYTLIIANNSDEKALITVSIDIMQN